MTGRWSAARGLVRQFVADRLSPTLARELLPTTNGEAEGSVVAFEARSFVGLAAAYPALLATNQRKQRGTWYTPPALATPTVTRTLAPLLADRGDALRICDPAAGGGTFLVAALQAMLAAGIPARRAALSLFGVDVDSTAAALAALAVHEACGDDAPDPLAIAANITAGDGLLDLRAGSFDAVLTNPPWETLQATAAARDHVARLRPRFHHQGRGKLYTYRLFVERSWQLLRAGGRFGLVVPASLWFDRDAEPLRRLLLDECRWEWLFGFENRKRVFAIDSRYRFAVVIGQKGGVTSAIKTAFGRTDPADWAAAEPRHVAYPTRLLTTLSPRHATFVECEHPRDLAILERMAVHGRPLIGTQGAFRWRQGDFNMTADRDRFELRRDAEARGYARHPDGVWRRAAAEATELLPLYQGAMVYDLHPNTGAHREGVGHKTTWEPPRALTELRPQYLVEATPWREADRERPPARIVLRALSNATNERTAVACLLPDVPCGNSLGVLTPARPERTMLRTLAAGAAVLGSLAFDWALRRRLTGTNLNGFVLADCVVPEFEPATETRLAQLALELCGLLPWHEHLWQLADAEGWDSVPPRPATARAERQLRFAELDTLIGRAYGLDDDDVAWITQDASQRGFGRVDRDLPAAERRPTRWRLAATGRSTARVNDG